MSKQIRKDAFMRTYRTIHVGKYYHVEMGMVDNRLFFDLDDKRIWAFEDEAPYLGGKIILRIRGTAHIEAACSIKNFKIYTKDDKLKQD